MKQVVLGILGAGRIGLVHARNAMAMKNAKIKIITDPFLSEEMANWASERGISTSLNSDDIFNDAEIDAVLICSSSDTHAEFIVKAAESGKHIFCEKPIDYDIQRIKSALAAVETAGVKLQVGFMRRFDHNHRKIHDAVKAGSIGNPHIIHITSRDPQSPPLAYVKRCGGFFYDMTIHDFDLARYISCSEITEVYAVGSVQFDQEIKDLGEIDTCCIMLKFENGAFGTIDNSRETHYGYVQRNEVFGSKGSIETFDDKPNTVVMSTAEGVLSEKPLWFFMDRYNDAFYAEIESFIDCVINDKTPYVTGEDGLRPVICAMACVKSLKEGRPVKISEIN